MPRISAGRTKIDKVAFPVIWFGALLLFAISNFPAASARADFLTLVVPVGLGIFGFIAMRYFLWDLADEVLDGGEALLVRRGKLQEKIAFTDIRDITFVRLRPPRIILHLDRASAFGNQIAFSPVARTGLNPFARNPILEELLLRLYRVRSGNANT